MTGAGASQRAEVARKTIDRLKNFSNHLDSGEPVSAAYSCRKIILNFEPPTFTPEMVKQVRSLLRVSQPLFANFLNVSKWTIQKWEQGKVTPDGAACRLMEDIRLQPDYWRKRLLAMSRSVSTGQPVGT